MSENNDLDLPTLVPLPGGAARLRPARDLAVRHTRPYSTVMMAIGPDLVAQMLMSQAVAETAEGGPNGPEAFARMVAELGLDYRQAELVGQLTDALIWKWVDSWTIRVPFPRSMGDVPNMPETVYGPLAQAASARESAWRQTQKDDPFTVGPTTLENPESPTGSSVA